MTTLFGNVAQTTNGFDLEFERVLDTDIQDAWSAVTEPDRIARWMETYHGDLRLGGTWRVYGSGGNLYCTGTVSECTPPHGFVTSWNVLGEEPTTLRITLDAVPDGTRLRLKHEGVQDERYGAGWQTYLEQLDDLLGAAPSSVVDPARTPGTDWDARHAQLSGAWSDRFAALKTKENRP
ncbi:MAG TPA: SRPBCC domain-containing protein [Homoserinimonas sp.]|nr:SRPBCC domain-containing protein [Homoserinimonas sp.]